MKILVCGDRSFAAQGLETELHQAGHEVTCFSRGTEGRNGNKVLGNILAMPENPHLRQGFDAVINFILVKHGSIEENLAYAKSLVHFCNSNNIKYLFQISTISTYPNKTSFVDENTPIETETAGKGSYASVKIAVDQYLQQNVKETKLIFLRPGFIISQDAPPTSAGILLHLPFCVSILLGDVKSTLPLINRQRMHQAIAKIMSSQEMRSVYHLFENNGGTKYSYAKAHFHKIILPLPKFPILLVAGLSKIIGLLSPRRFEQIRGLFKNTDFSSTLTEQHLNMRFDS